MIGLPTRDPISPRLLLALGALLVAGCGRPAATEQVARAPLLPAPTPIPTPVPVAGPTGSCGSRVTARAAAAANSWAAGFQVALGLAQHTRADLNTVVQPARSRQPAVAAANLAAAQSDLSNAQAALGDLQPPAIYRGVQRALAATLRDYNRMLAAATAQNAVSTLAGRGRDDGVLAAAWKTLRLRSAALAQDAPRLARCTAQRLHTLAAQATATVVARREARAAATVTAVAQATRTEEARLAGTATAVARTARTALARVAATETAVARQQVTLTRGQSYVTRLQEKVLPHLLGASLDAQLAVSEVAYDRRLALHRATLTLREVAITRRYLTGQAPTPALATTRQQLLTAAADCQQVATDITAAAHLPPGHATRLAFLHRVVEALGALKLARQFLIQAMASLGVHLILPE